MALEHTLSVPILTIILVFLILISAFFSSSETSMMALNRYKLRHLAKDKKHRGAMRVLNLLQRTDKLLTVILIGNTVANIFASAIATLIGAQLYGEKGILIATVALTLIILLFSEIGPKTLATIYPQRYAFFASIPLKLSLYIFYPIVWLGNSVVKSVLLLFHIDISKLKSDEFSSDELRSIFHETDATVTHKDQEMLVGIIDLDKISVEDIMVPRAEIAGINLDDEWPEIMKQLTSSEHTRLPLYENDLQHISGILHLREVLHAMAEQTLNKEILIEIAHEAYFVPETTRLKKQLIYFQKHKLRTALVVDEYGEIQGLIALDDILEEIVGNFTTNIAETTDTDIIKEHDEIYIIDGSVTIRELNRKLNMHFPTDKGKTINGLISAILEGIPNSGTCVKINGYPVEVIKVKENAIKTIKLFPRLSVT